MLYLKELDLQLITKSGEVDFRKTNFPFERPQLEWSQFKIEQETLGRKKKVTLLNGFMKSWGDLNITEGFPVTLLEVISVKEW